MIKYLGSKRLLLPAIVDAVGDEPLRVFDAFSGTARVGHALKTAGHYVVANDHNAYAHTLALCYVQANAARWLEEARERIAELDALPGRDGWFVETYCRRARYLQPANGKRVVAIRERIAEWALEPELEAILLTSLLEAADRVDSTTGVQMAFLKAWAPRAARPLELRVPEIREGSGRALRLEARAAAAQVDADLAYLDPPYNQHSYLGNYHVWETLVRWDEPEVYGVACKRVDCRERKSDFNSKVRIFEALETLLGELRCPRVLLSFNDEGYVAPEALRELLKGYGAVREHSFDYKRYVGAQIGIHDPNGRKVGTPGRLRNRELLFDVRLREIAHN